MKPSLRRRLLWLLCSAVLLAWCATALFTYFDAREQIGQMLDAHVVQIAERLELREELAQSVASHLLHPLAVALPILALLIWLSVHAGLLPLDALARQVQSRAPDNLAPLAQEDVPREVYPLVQSLNTLFARVHASLEQERRFTADAAHELRTPLAGVKTQAQVALAADSPAAQRRALLQVVRGVDRTTHLVEQLLVLARLDPQACLPTAAPVNLSELAAACIAEQAQCAAAKNVDLALAAPDGMVVWGDPTLLSVLLRNLLDNAIRYAPPAGEVEVSITRAPEYVVLRVCDNGPGIPENERSRVFDRFYRVLGSGEEGSGLGLSIVQRIADLHHASVCLLPGPQGRGLVVELCFAKPQDASGLRLN